MTDVKCDGCGRIVDERTIDRYGECSYCRAEEKSSDMTVGDLNGK